MPNYILQNVNTEMSKIVIIYLHKTIQYFYPIEIIQACQFNDKNPTIIFKQIFGCKISNKPDLICYFS